MQDLYNGMADIHCHILPEVDDGSDSLETSLEMAELSAECGVTDIVCTPHCIPQMFENYSGEKLKKRFDDFSAEVKKAGIPIKLHLGMEVYGCDRTFDDLEKNRLCSIAGSRYMLVEFNFGEYEGNVQTILNQVEDSGFVPVIAHPERYEFVADNPSLLLEWVDRGFLLQCNKDSIAGKFGRMVQRIVMDMLSDRLVAAVASDAHGALSRTPYLGYVYNTVRDNFGENYAKLIFCENPKRIIYNNSII